jgi:gas vesicle protein
MSSSPHRQNFYLGFLAGAVIGGGIAYLAKHRHNQQLKNHLFKKAKYFSQKLPVIIKQLTEQSPNSQPVHSNLKQELDEITTILTSDPDIQSEKSNSGLKPSFKTKITNTVKSTTQKAKKFFTRSGKKLTSK